MVRLPPFPFKGVQVGWPWPLALTSVSKEGCGHGHPLLPLSRESLKEGYGHGHPLLLLMRVEVRWFISHPVPSKRLGGLAMASCSDLCKQGTMWPWSPPCSRKEG